MITIILYLQHPDLDKIKTQFLKMPQVVVGPESDKKVEQRPIGDTLEVSDSFSYKKLGQCCKQSSMAIFSRCQVRMF